VGVLVHPPLKISPTFEKATRRVTEFENIIMPYLMIDLH
jgi:hypothetical protein